MYKGGDRGDGIASITDRAGLETVLQEAEESFHGWRKRAKNTQEFNEIIDLLKSIRLLLTEKKPVPASMILDLTREVWCGRNWERLPEPVDKRRRMLDGVVQRIGLAGDGSR
jgi:hypothetical protein